MLLSAKVVFFQFIYEQHCVIFLIYDCSTYQIYRRFRISKPFLLLRCTFSGIYNYMRPGKHKNSLRNAHSNGVLDILWS